MILLVWFHVLSMNTTLWRGDALDSETLASSGVPDCRSLAMCVAPGGSSLLGLFREGPWKESRDLLFVLSCKRCIMSCTATDPGPGNTSTTWRESDRRVRLEQNQCLLVSTSLNVRSSDREELQNNLKVQKHRRAFNLAIK